MCLGSRPLLVTVVLSVLLAAAACGPSVNNGDDDDDGDGGTGMCAEGATRCTGNTFEQGGAVPLVYGGPLLVGGVLVSAGVDIEKVKG